MNLNYDVKSLSMLGGLVSLALTVGMGCFGYRRKLYPGFNHWIYASFLSFLGATLISNRSILPDLVTIIIANLCLASFYVIVLVGINKFTSSKSKNIYFYICALVVMVSFFLFFTYISPNINNRIIAYSLSVSLITGIGLFTSIRNLKTLNLHRIGIITTTFSFISIWHLIIAIYTYWFENPIADFLSSGTIHQASFIFATISNVMIIIAMIVITSERLRDEFLRSNQELEKTLSEVKVLQGIVPICSYCKKVRNDQGYYEAVEAYISRHSEAKFSHGFCPDCYEKEILRIEKWGKRIQ